MLINDFQEKVDMSTYLESGDILVKVFKRFMAFTANGCFIDEVEFNEMDYDKSDEIEMNQID